MRAKMPIPKEPVVNITQSINAILSSKEAVVSRFYDRFLEEHPELRRLFARVDLRSQASMVTMSLVAVEAYFQNRFPATEHYFKVLGNRHYHSGVLLDDLPKFCLSMLRTLEEFHGADWSDDLNQQWRDALTLAIDLMQEGYVEQYTF